MDGGIQVILDLITSCFIVLILFLLIEKKFKGKERFLGYFIIATLLFILIQHQH